MKRYLIITMLLLLNIPVLTFAEQTILDAAQGNNIDMIEELISDNPNIDVNKKNDYGRTALDFAVSYKNVKMVKLLIKAGADVNSTNNTGDTALSEPYINNPGDSDKRIQIVKALIAAKTDVNIVNNEGNTALFGAISSDNTAEVKLLIKAGADVNLKNNDGETPLSLALEMPNKSIIKLLKDAGAKLSN